MTRDCLYREECREERGRTMCSWLMKSDSTQFVLAIKRGLQFKLVECVTQTLASLPICLINQTKSTLFETKESDHEAKG